MQELKQKPMNTRNPDKVRESMKGSPVGNSFLWREGFTEEIGFKSGMKKG